MKPVTDFLESARKVFLDCSLQNGAIVAANSDNPLYPKDVQNYRYVWPRDASFVCVAASIIGIRSIQKPFFKWILERAEEFSESGLLYQNYYTNGPKRWLAFQPDQNGTLLWAVHDFFGDGLPKEFNELVAKAADGLCNVWQKTHFNILTQDLWEESYTFPDIETTHTYSLAACAHGLELASRMIPSIRWLSVAKEMRQKIASSFHGYFYRCDGKLHDKRVDASLLGLVWPFRIYAADNSRMKATVAQIEKKLLRPEGVYRYEMDSYGGYRRQGIDTYRGAGAWPVNSFWLSIYYSLAGKKSRARKLFGSMLAHDKYFPEQFFDNKVQVSVKPLAWSHAMFVLAARELGLL